MFRYLVGNEEDESDIVLYRVRTEETEDGLALVGQLGPIGRLAPIERLAPIGHLDTIGRLAQMLEWIS